jgi:hypothetical protein
MAVTYDSQRRPRRLLLDRRGAGVTSAPAERPQTPPGASPFLVVAIVVLVSRGVRGVVLPLVIVPPCPSSTSGGKPLAVTLPARFNQLTRVRILSAGQRGARLSERQPADRFPGGSYFGRSRLPTRALIRPLLVSCECGRLVALNCQFACRWTATARSRTADASAAFGSDDCPCLTRLVPEAPEVGPPGLLF